MSNRLLALELARGLEPTASNLDRVSKQTDQETAAWAFTQWRLRKKAEAKFERAVDMLFVAEALEQATHIEVARYHASRFPAGVKVADLTCGIGGDLIALAERGPTVGYELDRERAEAARQNLKAYKLSAEVIETDSMRSGPHDYAIADPARRIGGKRTLDINEFEPNPVKVAAKLRQAKLACMKLSPMLADQDLESLSNSIEFISYGKECREALLWFGSEAVPGRWAVHVESGRRLPASQLPASTEEPAHYFYEADPAAIRAHCLGTLCATHDLKPLGDSNGYLTGAMLVDSPWISAFRVVTPPFCNERSVLHWLKTNDAKLTAVKSRLTGIDPSAVSKRLKTSGSDQVELAVYPSNKRLLYVLLKR